MQGVENRLGKVDSSVVNDLAVVRVFVVDV